MSIGKTHHRRTFTKTEQKKAVNAAFSLVRNGDSITRARKIIAEKYNVSPNTLWVWQNNLGLTVPNVIKTTDLVKNHGTTRKSTALSIKSGTTVIKGLEIMKGKLGTVFTSLVDQDGRFSNQDATAISGVANVILGSCKQVLLERKAMGKVNKTETLI